MWITCDKSGKISGRYQQRQEGMECIEVDASALESVPFPKWEKVKKKIVNDMTEQAAHDERHLKEVAYGYARDRAAAYIEAFSKAPTPNQFDALGHVVDAILSHLAGDDSALDEIQTKRAKIKAAYPKQDGG